MDIRLDKNNNITKYQCNCPHDADVCKHIVATLLKIKDETESAKTVKGKKKQKAGRKQIIDIIPEDKLRKFVKDYAIRNKKFKNELTIEFSEYDKTDNKGKYREIVNDAFSMAENRHGFIDYFHTDDAMSSIYDLLSKAEKFIKTENYKEAFAILSVIPSECIKAIQYMDDSTGECGGAISESFNHILAIHESSKEKELKSIVFEYLLEEVNNKDYDDYGCADELESILIDIVDTDNKIDSAMNFVEKKLKEASRKTGWAHEYYTKKYLFFKAELLKKSGQDDKANLIIYDNIHISDFREIVVDDKLKEKKVAEAVQLIEEGIKIAIENDLSGTVKTWKEKLLEIYKKQKDVENTRKYAKELFFGDRYDMNYYKVLKKTWNKDLWNAEKDKIITQIMKIYNKPTYFGNNFPTPVAEIYVEEKMWSELFVIVKKSARINTLQNYAKYLKKEYAQELINMYKTAIEDYTEKNTGRSAYKNC